MKITNTKEQAQTHGVKILVHGPAGAGKTRLCATTGELDKTIILSAEAGLLSLREHSIDVLTINSLADMREALVYVKTTDQYTWVCIDSLSEVAEVVLAQQMEEQKDGRAAYGEMHTVMTKLIRAFRDLPGRNVVMTCKTEKTQVDGRMQWSPMLPGRQLSQGIPYLFDEVFAMRVHQGDDGELTRYLQTQDDGYHVAKDRSGALELHEVANLEDVVKRIKTVTR